jgi:hypothetical protein
MKHEQVLQTPEYDFPHGFVPRGPYTRPRGNGTYSDPDPFRLDAESRNLRAMLDNVQMAPPYEPPGVDIDKVHSTHASKTQVGGQHYAKHAIQPWDYVAANNLGYFEGSIIKYVTRWKDKGGLEDLKKARHFLDKLIEVSS